MLTDDNEFQYFHAYNELVRESKALPLACLCGSKYVTLARDGRLALWCPMEDMYTIPGLKTIRFVEQTVDKHMGEQ